MSWLRIYFNTQNIIGESAKSLKIMMPRMSEYNDYSFWISKRLVSEAYGKGYHWYFSLKEDFTFTLCKFSKSRYRRGVIDKKEVGTGDMFRAFGQMHEMISSSAEIEEVKAVQKKYTREITELHHHVPDKVHQEVEHDKDLFRQCSSSHSKYR